MLLHAQTRKRGLVDRLFDLGISVEMAAWKAVGTWLEGSGWSDVLSESNIATSGKAESYLQASHLKRTRYAHQVTAASLHILCHQAYEYFLADQGTANYQSFEAWCEERANKYPMFTYCYLVLEQESLRSCDFSVYIEALKLLMPWFFALNRTNCSRWLSIHVRDMQLLKANHPELVVEFESGKFTFQKTNRAFSAMPLDRIHEMNNKQVKGDGGCIGLTEDSHALLRWMISGPEISILLSEFEEPTIEESSLHHDQLPYFQSLFKNHVQAMVATLAKLGNPYCEDSQGLVSLIS